MNEHARMLEHLGCVRRQLERFTDVIGNQGDILQRLAALDAKLDAALNQPTYTPPTYPPWFAPPSYPMPWQNPVICKGDTGNDPQRGTTSEGSPATCTCPHTVNAPYYPCQIHPEGAP